MINIRKMNESFIVLHIDDEELKLKVMKDWLSVFVEGYRFQPRFRAGMWDGKKNFFRIDDDFNLIVPQGLLGTIISKCNKDRIEFELDKELSFKDEITIEEFNEFVKSLNMPFEPYDYQMKAAFECINNKKQIALAATGSGKSAIQSIIIRYLLSKDKKVVLIVPNVSLLSQFKSDMQDYFKDWDIEEHLHLIGGDNIDKHFDKPLTITTWQSMMNNKHLFHEADVVMTDEVHLAKGEQLMSMLQESKNAEYRLGFTGTLPKVFADRMTIISSFGKPITYVKPSDLIEMGLATPLEVKALFFNYSDEVATAVKNMNYQKEKGFLNIYEPRNNLIAKIADKISKSGNTLLLFDTVKHGEYLLEQIVKDRGIEFENKKSFTKVKDNESGIFFVSGSVKGSDREDIRKVLDEKNNVILLGTSSILSTGINIKNLHNLVLTGQGKSFVKISQSLGRGMRLHPSKEVFKIYDIVDDLRYINRNGNKSKKNYFLKHFETRLSDVYMENGYPVAEREMNVGS